MRIVIETEDTRPPVASTAGLLAAPAPSEAADGGAGPSAGAGSPTSDAESVDTGGPPQWLLNAVAREMAASGSSDSGARNEADGGAGPQ
jgi:hypothetical protein